MFLARADFTTCKTLCIFYFIADCFPCDAGWRFPCFGVHWEMNRVERATLLLVIFDFGVLGAYRGLRNEFHIKYC